MVQLEDKLSGLTQTMLSAKDYIETVKSLDWGTTCLQCDHHVPLLDNNLCADCDNPLMAMENEHLAKGKYLLKLPSRETSWLYRTIQLQERNHPQ